MSSPEDKLIQYLNEAHATELALVSTLRAHIAVSPSGSYRSLLERHLGDTRRQAVRLERRLSDLGVSRSLIGSGVGAVQSLIGQVLALTKAPIDLLRGGGGEEKLLKNAKDECATEALEIATYDALEQVALELGDELTAELAREHRAEEEAMLAGLRAEIPGLARDAVAAEVYGIEVYDSSEIGAAQAARSAAGAASDAATELASDAVGETEKVASKAAGAAKETAKEARKVPGVEEAEGEVRGAVAGEDDLPIASYDSLKAGEIVERLPRLTQVELGVVDAIIAEPGEGAHTDHEATAGAVKAAILSALRRLTASETDALLATRYARLRGMGAYLETGAGPIRPPEAPSLRRRIGRILHLPGVPRRPRWSEIWPSDGNDDESERGA